MKGTIFNIDKTVKLTVDLDGKYRVWQMWVGKNQKCGIDVLGRDRFYNVKSAIEYMLKDTRVESANTECGVTVYRGTC